MCVIKMKEGRSHICHGREVQGEDSARQTGDCPDQLVVRGVVENLVHKSDKQMHRKQQSHGYSCADISSIVVYNERHWRPAAERCVSRRELHHEKTAVR